jgi:hypothetical protein
MPHKSVTIMMEIYFEEFCLLGYSTAYSAESQLIFQRNMLPPSSASGNKNKPRNQCESGSKQKYILFLYGLLCALSLTRQHINHILGVSGLFSDSAFGWLQSKEMEFFIYGFCNALLHLKLRSFEWQVNLMNNESDLNPFMASIVTKLVSACTHLT